MSTRPPSESEFEQLVDGLRRLPRAVPSHDLFVGIQARIRRADAHVVSLAEWRIIAVAAVLLLSLNLLALYYFGSAEALPDTDTYALVTDYRLYD